MAGRRRDGAFEPGERRREIVRQARLVTHLEQCADVLRIDLEGTGQQAFGGRGTPERPLLDGHLGQALGVAGVELDGAAEGGQGGLPPPGAALDLGEVDPGIELVRRPGEHVLEYLPRRVEIAEVATFRRELELRGGGLGIDRRGLLEAAPGGGAVAALAGDPTQTDQRTEVPDVQAEGAAVAGLCLLQAAEFAQDVRRFRPRRRDPGARQP